MFGLRTANYVWTSSLFWDVEKHTLVAVTDVSGQRNTGPIFKGEAVRRIQRDIIINISLQLKYPLFMSDFNETGIFLTDFRKTKVHDNPSSGSWAAPCGQTSDMTKLTVTFRNFKIAPSNLVIVKHNMTSISETKYTIHLSYTREKALCRHCRSDGKERNMATKWCSFRNHNYFLDSSQHKFVHW